MLEKALVDSSKESNLEFRALNCIVVIGASSSLLSYWTLNGLQWKSSIASRSSPNTLSGSSLCRGEMGANSVPEEKPEALAPVLDTLAVTGGELVIVVVVVPIKSMKRGLDNGTEA